MQFKSMSSFMNKTQTDLERDFEKYVKICEDLRENFSKRFQDLNCQETQMYLFLKPFGVNVENVNGSEKVLRSNEVLHNPFQENSLTN